MICVVATFMLVGTGVTGTKVAMVAAETEVESPDGFLTVGMSELEW